MCMFSVDGVRGNGMGGAGESCNVSEGRKERWRQCSHLSRLLLTSPAPFPSSVTATCCPRPPVPALSLSLPGVVLVGHTRLTPSSLVSPAGQPCLVHVSLAGQLTGPREPGGSLLPGPASVPTPADGHTWAVMESRVQSWGSDVRPQIHYPTPLMWSVGAEKPPPLHFPSHS